MQWRESLFVLLLGLGAVFVEQHHRGKVARVGSHRHWRHALVGCRGNVGLGHQEEQHAKSVALERSQVQRSAAELIDNSDRGTL